MEDSYYVPLESSIGATSRDSETPNCQAAYTKLLPSYTVPRETIACSPNMYNKVPQQNCEKNTAYLPSPSILNAEQNYAFNTIPGTAAAIPFYSTPLGAFPDFTSYCRNDQKLTPEYAVEDTNSRWSQPNCSMPISAPNNYQYRNGPYNVQYSTNIPQSMYQPMYQPTYPATGNYQYGMKLQYTSPSNGDYSKMMLLQPPNPYVTPYQQVYPGQQPAWRPYTQIGSIPGGMLSCNNYSGLPNKRQRIESSISNEDHLENEVVQMLCLLGERPRKTQPSPAICPSLCIAKTPISVVQPVDGETPSFGGKGFGHVLCTYCQKRNALRTPEPPPSMHCYSCNRNFIVVRRYLHGYGGPLDPLDVSLELPCLRGVMDSETRKSQLDAYLQSVLTGRRCGFSARLRDLQKMMVSLVSKVDKMLTREQKHADEECELLMGSLLTRVEQYCEGELHCRCLQPAYAQRHFIQCDVCDLWYHTSCVGVDSRKLATIMEFSCPSCTRKHCGEEIESLPSEEGVEVEEDKTCQCPLCERMFPRPCNLSRHLHAKHNMKWNTHVMLHMDVDDYLEKESEDMQWTSAPAETRREICEGCTAVGEVNEDYPMSKSQFRFLLRKIRMKQSQWWIGKSILIWNSDRGEFAHGIVKCIRPRSEFCVRMDDGSSVMINNFFDPVKRVRLLILQNSYELELYRALPFAHSRSLENDISLFVKTSVD